jgi:CRP/FNR family transcriptional regulator, cyclic AMP receptor protein
VSDDQQRSASGGGGMRWEVLEAVPEADVRRVIQVAVRRDWRAGEVVFHQGDPADSLHLIRRGRFGVETAGLKTAVVAVLGPGEMFGEIALVDEAATRSARVSALEGASTLALTKVDFDRLRLKHPSVDRVLVAILAAQVRRLTAQVVEGLYVSPQQRVRRRLCSLAETYDDRRGPPEIRLTRTVLGQLAGTNRQQVSDVLSVESALGTIARRRGRVTVLDAERLRRRAEPADAPPAV